MKALLSSKPPLTNLSKCNLNSVSGSRISLNLSSLWSQPVRPQNRIQKCLTSRPRSQSHDQELEDDDESQVQDLRVPNQWSEPSKAMEEAEWLRVTLHKWLDDEYCPEPTNVEISNVAANSYRRSLIEKQTDLGEILLKMARELETISYQESFHGAFSSANAAISLIAERIDQQS